jgi:uncharacterized protein (TIGR02265 family)
MTAALLTERSESVVQHSVFEGLFVHALHPCDAFAEELRRAGYDLRHREPAYPGRVFAACLQVACRQVHPTLPEPFAMRLLGERFLEGFLQTLTGRLVAPALTGLGPAGVLKRLPRFISLGTSATRVAVHQEGAQSWRVELWGRHPLPDFQAGLITHVLERTGVCPGVAVVTRSEDGFVLRVRWEEAPSPSRQVQPGPPLPTP